MAVEYVDCCGSYVDLDWNVDDVIYYEDEPWCYDHLLEHLCNTLEISEEKADEIIDQL